MKKTIAAILAIVSLCLCLTSCDPGTTFFSRDYSVEGIVKVELIKYDNPDQGEFITWVLDQTDKLLPYDVNKETLLATLDTERINAFTEQLSQYDILDKYFAYDSPNGMCIKMTYKNGDFVIINCAEDSFAGYIGKYRQNGEVASFLGCFSNRDYFERLVEDNFDYISVL